MYNMIPNSDINILGTLHATFLALLHNQLTGYITSVNKVDIKLTNYQSDSNSFTMANHLQKYQYFSDHLLRFIKIKEL